MSWHKAVDGRPRDEHRLCVKGVLVSLGILFVVVMAVFVFIPQAQGVVLPMPGTVGELVRESEGKAPVDGVVHHDLVYKRARFGGHRLDLYEPLGSFEGRRSPLVIFFHGGSWIHGDKITIRVVDRFLERMRRAGYFVASVNYTTTVFRGLTGPVENAKAALRRLGEWADEYGYDRHNIGLYGVSAGGHVALMAASTMDEREDFSLAFVFAECAPTDLVGMRDGEAFEHSVVFRAFPERKLRSLSPITHVNDRLPPVLLYHGGRDRTVDVRQSERYADVLQEAGLPVDLVIYPEGDHAFLNLSDETWFEQETRGLAWFEKQFRRRSVSPVAPEPAE